MVAAHDALAGPRFPMARDDALNLLVNAIRLRAP
jgi:hypothetical protein